MVRDSLDPTPFESIWAFTPDGRGSGSWKEVLGPTGTQVFHQTLCARFMAAFAMMKAQAITLEDLYGTGQRGPWGVARTLDLSFR